MLVLSRRPGSSIRVGHDIMVTVEMVAGDDVCLSVAGPESVSVQRLDEHQVIGELARLGKDWEPERMHVLSRRPRPGLVINDEVVVAVQAISNESVRIGIHAPSHVLVCREEIYQQVQEASRPVASDAEVGLVQLFPRDA